MPYKNSINDKISTAVSFHIQANQNEKHYMRNKFCRIIYAKSVTQLSIERKKFCKRFILNKCVDPKMYYYK